MLPNNYYHIYNHGNGHDNLFIEERNYAFFLQQYEKFIASIAETYAFSLMPNHFHLVVKIKDTATLEKFKLNHRSIENINPVNNENLDSNVALEKFKSNHQCIENINLVNNKTLDSKETFPKLNPVNNENLDNTETFPKLISKQFSNLFSSYTQSFNKVYKRKGSLFIKNFKRKLITDDDHLRNTIMYLHINPVHHGFTTDFTTWKWHSFHSFADRRYNFINYDHALSLFGDAVNFNRMHLQAQERKLLQLNPEFEEW